MRVALHQGASHTIGKLNLRRGSQPRAQSALEKQDVGPLVEHHGVAERLGGAGLLAALVVGVGAHLASADGASELDSKIVDDWGSRGGGRGRGRKQERLYDKNKSLSCMQEWC